MKARYVVFVLGLAPVQISTEDGTVDVREGQPNVTTFVTTCS
jgi:hypothetical protein